MIRRLGLTFLAMLFASFCSVASGETDYCEEVKKVCTAPDKERALKRLVDEYDSSDYMQDIHSPAATARMVVSCISSDMEGSMLVSFSRLASYILPDWRLPVKLTPDSTPTEKKIIQFQEEVSRLSFYRCLTDRWFFDGYVHVSCWSGTLVQRHPEGIAHQRFAMNNVVSRLDEQIEDEDAFWRTAVQVLVLSHLFGYEEPDFVASSPEATIAFCKRSMAFVMENRFRIAESRLGWEAAEDGLPLAELPFLPVPDLPAPEFSPSEFEWLREGMQ